MCFDDKYVQRKDILVSLVLATDRRRSDHSKYVVLDLGVHYAWSRQNFCPTLFDLSVRIGRLSDHNEIHI